MGILLSFLPFIVFALVDRIVGPVSGLAAGAVASAAVIAFEWFRASRSPRILEIGSLCLFGGLAAYAAVNQPGWSLIAVRLMVDLGLFVLVVFSLLIGRPFTEQYAREKVPPEAWSTPRFHKVNRVVTSAWAVAFGVLVIADLVMLCVPSVPLRVGIWTTVVALYAAIKFTQWYPGSTHADANGRGV